MSLTGIRLSAPLPSWAIEADVAVVGSGVAGLTVALRCAAAGLRTVIVTKARLDDGSTRWAQGGIAAALGEGDTPGQHLDDTLVAGAGLCDEEAVRILVTEGPDAVRRLIASGAVFDTSAETGEIELTREGGHHRRRIAHAGGDATGAEISRALVGAVRSGAAGPAIRTIENALVLDLLRDGDGRTAGVSLHVMGEGQHDGVGAVHAPAVVLATGGMGQIFSATTNPAVSTGDGVALALRAGAEVSDLEFVQFHPTVLWLGPDSRGQQPLVSEAVRGEGAYLVDADGVRFMQGRHELAELAPRDIVAKGIMRRMHEQGAEHMYLDARHFGARMWAQRFPTILAACREHGIDPVTEPIPVAPAAHYASGGVRTDLYGRTTVPGLYACGEVACTGVHGANRLASNSLLEGLVFAERIAMDIAAGHSGVETAGSHLHAEQNGQKVEISANGHEGAVPGNGWNGGIAANALNGSNGWNGSNDSDASNGLEGVKGAIQVAVATTVPLLPPEARPAIQWIMTRRAGVLRSAESLADAAAELDRIASDMAHKAPEPGVESWETTNLHLIARVLVTAARHRTETRGCHWREDHPVHDDGWRRHLVLTLRPGAPDRTAGAPSRRTPGARDSLTVRSTDGNSFPPTVPSAVPPAPRPGSLPTAVAAPKEMQ